MNAIRVKRKLSSDTLVIPELAPMIGQEVEIIVLEDKPSAIDQIDKQAFWKGKSVDELAKEQGTQPLQTLRSPFTSAFTPEDFEGFEEALEQWRNEGRR